MSNTAIVLAALLGASEALALVPAIKANSVFQLFFNLIKGLAGK